MSYILTNGGCMDRLKQMWLRTGSFFSVPSAEELALLELEEAKRAQLAAMTAQDYSRQMVEYHRARIIRLTAYLAKASEQREPV
jgi:hypothetical protein